MPQIKKYPAGWRLLHWLMALMVLEIDLVPDWSGKFPRLVLSESSAVQLSGIMQ